MRVLAVTWVLFGLFVGCAKERPPKPVIANPARIRKTDLGDGKYVFLKSVVDVKYATAAFDLTPTGVYLESNRLVQFKIQDTTLDVVSIEPLMQAGRPTERNGVIASFPIEHVDVIRKQNQDGIDTNEEEETKTRRPAEYREYVIVDAPKDLLEPLGKNTRTATAPAGLQRDAETGIWKCDVQRTMHDGTQLTERYQWVPFTPSATYVQRDYPRSLQQRFGFFKTTTFRYNRYGQVTSLTREEFMNRWDLSKPVRYYLSKGFPEFLKPAVRRVFKSWNRALAGAVRHEPLVLVEENKGQELGDLRYNMIHYEDVLATQHGILGYGPVFANPQTGEILKADVILYGGTLKQALQNERHWENLLKGGPATVWLDPAGDAGIGGGARVKNRGYDRPALENALVDFTRGAFQRFTRDILPSGMSDLNRQITRLPPDSMLALVRSTAVPDPTSPDERLADERVEELIFEPLLAHEMGHTLGLRHNFMGSVDKANFPTPIVAPPRPGVPPRTPESSTVMDYGFLAHLEGVEVGDYDRDAMIVLYGAAASPPAAVLAKNYLYCSDEHAFSSKHALCNPYDRGTTLDEIVVSHARRYKGSYFFNNLRGTRVFFEATPREYFDRISLFLIPLRQAYDFATGVVDAHQRDSLIDLWDLLRQRIEADPVPPADDTVTVVRITENFTVDTHGGVPRATPWHFERRISKKKREAAVRDALNARRRIVEFFRDQIRSTRLPEYDTPDIVSDEVLVRGILQDKMLMLELLTSRSPSPLGRGAFYTPFDVGSRDGTLEFLANVLSDTFPVLHQPSGFMINDLAGFNPNLRELVFRILTDELGGNRDTAQARELIPLEIARIDVQAFDRARIARFLGGVLMAVPGGFPLPGPIALPAQLKGNEDARDYETTEDLRLLMREQYYKIYSGSLPPPRVTDAESKIYELERTRNKVQAAFMRFRTDQVLKAKTRHEVKGWNTATGYWIRDNINRREDRFQAVNDLYADTMLTLSREEAKAVEDQRAWVIEDARALLGKLELDSANLSKDLAAEKQFLERVYRYLYP